jgi:hypothetical protein
VPVEPVRVLVLYSHPLLGEGLARMLSSEVSLDVQGVNIEGPEDLELALEASAIRPPAAIVVEEGGRIDAVEVIRRTRSPIVIGVDIGSAEAWTLRRSAIRSGPDEVIDAILDAIWGDARPPEAPACGPAPVGRMEPARLPG